MPEMNYKKVKIKEICRPAKTDKTLTKAKAKENGGIYPVYAATIGKAFAYINTFNNTDSCLVVVNDGDAGNTYIVTDKQYTIGKHATGLIPVDDVDITYLQKIATPIFMKIAKGYGLGNLPQEDIFVAEVSIPIKNGKYDITLQKKLAEVYAQIYEQRNLLLSKINILADISVYFQKDNSILWKEVTPTDLFIPKGGNMSYNKIWAKENPGEYPLYSGTTSGSYALVNKFDYNGEYLTWCIDGLAGNMMYHNEAFSVTCHRGVLVPKEDVDFTNIDLKYIKYNLEPLFRKRKKGREGDLGKNEYTSLKPIAIKKMKDTIPIPINDDGSYNLIKQKELASKYEQIDIIKTELINKIRELTSIMIL